MRGVLGAVVLSACGMGASPSYAATPSQPAATPAAAAGQSDVPADPNAWQAILNSLPLPAYNDPKFGSPINQYRGTLMLPSPRILTGTAGLGGLQPVDGYVMDQGQDYVINFEDGNRSAMLMGSDVTRSFDGFVELITRAVCASPDQLYCASPDAEYFLGLTVNGNPAYATHWFRPEPLASHVAESRSWRRDHGGF
jgi:hypothetical protein